MTLPALRRKARRRQLLRWTLAGCLLNGTGIAVAPSGIASDETGTIRHANATEQTELPVQIPTLPPLPVPTEHLTTPQPVAAANPNQTTMRLRPGGVVRGNPYLNAGNASQHAAAVRGTAQTVRKVSGQTELSQSEIVLKSPTPAPRPATAGVGPAPAGTVLKLRPAAPAQTLLPFSNADITEPNAPSPTPRSNLHLRPASHTAETTTRVEAVTGERQQVETERDTPARFTFSDSGSSVSSAASSPQPGPVVPARPANLLPVNPDTPGSTQKASESSAAAEILPSLKRRSIVGSAPADTNSAPITVSRKTVDRTAVAPANAPTTAAFVVPPEASPQSAAQLAPVPRRSLSVATPNSTGRGGSQPQTVARGPVAQTPATRENSSAKASPKESTQATPLPSPFARGEDADSGGTSFRIADPAPLHLGSRTTVRVAKAPANLPKASLSKSDARVEKEQSVANARGAATESVAQLAVPQTEPRASVRSRAIALEDSPISNPHATAAPLPEPPAPKPDVAKSSVKSTPIANASASDAPVKRIAIPQPPAEPPASIATAVKPAPRPTAARVALPQPRSLEELQSTAKPVATKPIATKPVATKPVATKPVAAKPIAAKSNAAGATITNVAPQTQLTQTPLQASTFAKPTPRPAATQSPAATKTPAAAIYRPSRNLVIDLEQTSEPSGTRMERLQQVVSRVMEDETVFAGQPTETLRIQRAETHSLSPEAGVRRVQLQDREICEAVLVGPHKLLLIGRKTGSTRIAIWCGDEEQPRLCAIEVRAEEDAPLGASLDAVATRLTETIGATYPNSRVRVVHDGDGLTVIGQTQDDRTAREILRLVRNACLKTVNDRLQVR